MERQLEQEADDEIRNWEQQEDEYDDAWLETQANADILDAEFWEEWKYPMDEDEEIYYEEIRNDLKSKDKEKKDASTD